MLLILRESFVRDQGVGGSNPLAPINRFKQIQARFGMPPKRAVDVFVGEFPHKFASFNKAASSSWPPREHYWWT